MLLTMTKKSTKAPAKKPAAAKGSTRGAAKAQRDDVNETSANASNGSESTLR